MILNEKKFLIDSFSNYLSEKTFVTEIENNRLYTDSGIRNEFNDIISKQSIDDKFKPRIYKLVDSNFVIPCYIHESLLNKLENSLFNEGKTYTRFTNVLGFYHTEVKRIFILIRNIQNFDYWSKNDLISNTLVHEFQHCFLNLFPNSFVNLHRKALDLFYSCFLNKYFGIKESVSSARQMYEFLISNFDAPSSSQSKNVMPDYLYLLQKLSVPEKKRSEFKDVLTSFYSRVNEYHDNVKRKKSPSYDIYINLRDSYSKLGIVPRMINSLCIQECIFAGEVICLESEYNRKSRHLSLIDRLKVD